MLFKRNNEITKQRNNEATNVVSLCRRIVVSFMVLLISVQKVFAASVWDDDTVLSPPVGRSVLPGGGLQAEEIKESFVFSKLLPFVINYAIGAAVALSVIVLILGGYKFMTAYGDQEKQQSAKKTLTYALIGLILALTAYGIVAIVTSIRLSAVID